MKQCINEALKVEAQNFAPLLCKPLTHCFNPKGSLWDCFIASLFYLPARINTAQN